LKKKTHNEHKNRAEKSDASSDDDKASFETARSQKNRNNFQAASVLIIIAARTRLSALFAEHNGNLTGIRQTDIVAGNVKKTN